MIICTWYITNNTDARIESSCNWVKGCTLKWARRQSYLADNGSQILSDLPDVLKIRMASFLYPIFVLLIKSKHNYGIISVEKLCTKVRDLHLGHLTDKWFQKQTITLRFICPLTPLLSLIQRPTQKKHKMRLFLLVTWKSKDVKISSQISIENFTKNRDPQELLPIKNQNIKMIYFT